MLKVAIFSWLRVFGVSFACWFFVFLSYCYFLKKIYPCTTITIGITITIISSNISEGEGHRKQATSCEVLSSGTLERKRGEQLQSLFYCYF